MQAFLWPRFILCKVFHFSVFNFIFKNFVRAFEYLSIAKEYPDSGNNLKLLKVFDQLIKQRVDQLSDNTIPSLNTIHRT